MKPAAPPPLGPLDLQRFVAGAIAAWPGIEIDVDAFARRVRKCIGPDFGPHALDRLRGPELALAYACSIGDPKALRWLEEHYGNDIDAPLRRIRDPHLRLEDLRQIVRLRLLVSNDEGPPVIARYGGVGRLAAWLRVTARRTALNATRRLTPTVVEPKDDRDLLGSSSALDPELGYLRDAYGDAFRQAFSEAAAALSPREQTLLRMAYVQRLRVRTIGRMYAVHHATAARWVTAARRSLVDATLARLRTRLRVSESQLQSIMALIGSRVELELSALFGSGEPTSTMTPPTP